MKRWIGWTILATLVVAVATHGVTLMTIPHNIMNDTMNEKFKALPRNEVFHAPPTTAESRGVVRPSPDLLYSICLYDVTERPLRLTALVPDSYWSVSCYASNTDNFFVMNDQQVKSNPVEVLLVGKNMPYTDTGNAEVVVAPSDKGIVLFRLLITDEDELDDLIQVQKQVSCKVEGAPVQKEAAKEPVEGELPFEAAEYVNTDYGFSIKYPSDWAAREVEEPTVLYAAASAQVPVIAVNIVETATFADAVTAALKASGSHIEIVSQTETTLADGAPATEARIEWKLDAGFPGDTFVLGVQKDGKWVMVAVTTVSMLVPYDEARFSEIAHTLQFE